MIKNVLEKGDPMDGIVQYLQNKTSDDIIATGYANIYVPSKRISEQFPSSDPKVMFGIGNPNYNIFWSSNDGEPNKYVIFAFKYVIKLKGIGLNTNTMDWYKKYEISTSNDGISFNSKFEIEIVENPQKKSYYYELHDLKPGSFIKITPSKEYLNDKDNYAFYGVEFFGEIYHNFQNSYPQNQFHYTFLFSIYTIISLI